MDQPRFKPSTLFRNQRGGGDRRGPLLIPAVMQWLGGAMIIVFLAERLLPIPVVQRAIDAMVFSTFRISMAAERGVLDLELLTFVSHAFLHGNLSHIGFNLIWFLVFGGAVARRLQVESAPTAGARAANTAVYLAFFACSAAAGAIVFYFLSLESGGLLVGASGGISGLMGGAVRFAFRRLPPGAANFGALSPITAQPVLAVTALFVMINLATAVDFMTGGAPIAWDAHLGGYFFGLLTFPLFDRLTRRRGNNWA